MQSDNLPPDPDRRAFLRRTFKAGLCVAAAGAVGFGFHDRTPPDPLPADDPTVDLPDFSIPGMAPKMAIVRGADRRQTLPRALAALGGIEAFVRPGERVLLKVNAAFASPPLLGATTHPDLVAAMTTLCFEAGAASVAVTDNPINDPVSCFRLSGIETAARKNGARLLLPSKERFRPVTVPGGRLIRVWPVLADPLLNVDKVIGLAPVKDHHRSGASMILKNWYGLLGGRRNVFHQDIHGIIEELARMVKPSLVILDGTVSLMTNGPTGGSLADLKPTGTLIASTDQVAADAFGAALLDRRPAELAFIARAAAAGAGTADYESLRPLYL
jgi:uncharacterized protein (DUF362 family)